MTKTLLDKLVKYIPNDWMSMRLKEIVIMEKGKKPDKLIEEYTCGLKPYLTAENMRKNDYTLWCEEGKSMVKSNKIDTLLIWDGSNAGEVFQGKDGIVVSTMVKVTPRTENVNRKYLLYSISDHTKILRSTTNGTSIPHVSQYVFNNLIIPLPPLSEQQKIAAILSTVDDVIEKTRAVIEETKQLKKGMMQKLFTEGIGHTRFKETKIGRIPEAWEVTKLEDICLKRTKKFEPKYSKEKYPYIGLEHIESAAHKINGVGKSDETLSTKNKFNEGDILYGKLRPYLDKVWLAEFDGVCTTEILVLNANKRSIQYFLFSILQRSEFISFANSLTEGTSLPRVNWKDIVGFRIALPPIGEQSQIAQILSEIDSKIEKEEAIKEQLEKLKKGLMQVLLTGKIRVKV